MAVAELHHSGEWDEDSLMCDECFQIYIVVINILLEVASYLFTVTNL